MNRLRSLLLVFSLFAAVPLHTVARADDHSGDVLDDDGRDFMLNAAIGLILHEFGHSLIRENDAPVIGNEETAADNFVPVVLFEPSDTLDGEDRAQALVDHVNSWLYAAKWSARRLSLQGLSYYDEHETDVRRAYTLMCLMVGGSKSTFAGMATAYGMPDARQEKCKYLLMQTKHGWEQVLADVKRGAAEPSQTKVIYEEAPNYAPYREAMIENELFETAAALVAEQYQLPDDMTIKGRDCGGRGDGTSYGSLIEICYERVQFYYYLWDTYGRDDETRDSAEVGDTFYDDTASGDDAADSEASEDDEDAESEDDTSDDSDEDDGSDNE